MDDERRSQTDSDKKDQQPPRSSGRRRRRRDTKQPSAAPLIEGRREQSPSTGSNRSARTDSGERRSGSQPQGGRQKSSVEQGKSDSASQQARGENRPKSPNRSRRAPEGRAEGGARAAAPPRPPRPQAGPAANMPVPRGYLAAAFDESEDLAEDDLVEPAAPPATKNAAKAKASEEPPRQEEKPKSDESASQDDRRGRRRKRKPRNDLAGQEPPKPRMPEDGPRESAAVSGPGKPARERGTTAQQPQGRSSDQTSRGPAAKGERRPAGKRAEPKRAPIATNTESDELPRSEDPSALAKAPRPTRARPAAGAFAAMGLSDDLLEALFKADYLEPTPVQAGLIPRALAGADVMGQARTGTGKTAAFAIPILQRVAAGKAGAQPRALALVPTRELAVQVRDECQKLALFSEHRVAAVYGGKPIRQQADQLRRGVDVLIGTPGRVIDMINRGLLGLGDLQVVVLDEADRMLDIGFRPDIERILRRCPSERQTLLLSATIPPPVKRLAERYMRSPEVLDFSAGDVAVETIEQFYFTVDPERKFDLLIKLIEREQPRQAIVFVRTRRGADRLFRKLSPLFEAVDAIHGDLAQSARDRVMRRFREGKSRILVATDVVGRGIDVSGISHIINFDVPQFCDDYVHRVGRTGRMGREGVAFTFVTPEEGNELTRIEMRINRLLKRDEISGFVALEKPQPTEQLDEPSDGPEPSKAVFGRPSKRYRRAL